jgi:ABC-type multidrug transport system ATPase subunit
VFVSTHVISGFEGLIDEFTILERGKAVLTLDADGARDRSEGLRAVRARRPRVRPGRRPRPAA